MRRIGILRMTKECLGKILALPNEVSVDRVTIDPDIRSDEVLIRLSAPPDCKHLPAVLESGMIPFIDYPLEKEF